MSATKTAKQNRQAIAAIAKIEAMIDAFKDEFLQDATLEQCQLLATMLEKQAETLQEEVECYEGDDAY